MTTSDLGSTTDRHLVLVRHARSAHAHTGWMNADDFRAWRAAYEAAGIRPGERVPTSLARLAAAADLVVCSDAARAVETARLLTGGRALADRRELIDRRELTVSPLLRELELAGPAWNRVRLPLAGWALAVGGSTLWQSFRGTYPPAAEAARIAAASAWLGTLADRHPSIVVVTHASFRQRLAARLLRDGWKAEPGGRSMRNWSAWVFCRSTPTAGG